MQQTHDHQQEIEELYQRGDAMRRMALDGVDEPDERDAPAPRRRRRARRRRVQITSTMLLFFGVSMILYGLIAGAAEMLRRTVSPQAPVFGSVSSGQAVAGCQAAIADLDAAPAVVLESPPVDDALSAENAERTADDLLRRYLSLTDGEVPLSLSGPQLVDLHLSGEHTRQAWARLWVLSQNSPAADMEAAPEGAMPASILYVDAASGEPLLLVNDIYLTDPRLPGCEETAVEAFLENLDEAAEPLTTSVVNGVIAVMGLVVLASWQQQNSRRRKAAPPPPVEALPPDEPPMPGGI